MFCLNPTSITVPKQLDIFLGELQATVFHVQEVRVGPVCFHDAGLSMAICPAQNVRDFVGDRVPYESWKQAPVVLVELNPVIPYDSPKA